MAPPLRDSAARARALDGDPARLDRDLSNPFGSDATLVYSWNLWCICAFAIASTGVVVRQELLTLAASDYRGTVGVVTPFK
jgi:hypothetical protein